MRKKLLNCLKETRRYWRLKEEALYVYRTLWGTYFRRVYGPVVRQTRDGGSEVDVVIN